MRVGAGILSFESGAASPVDSFCLRFSSRRIVLQMSMHSLQMLTPGGPEIRLLTF